MMYHWNLKMLGSSVAASRGAPPHTHTHTSTLHFILNLMGSVLIPPTLQQNCWRSFVWQSRSSKVDMTCPSLWSTLSNPAKVINRKLFGMSPLSFDYRIFLCIDTLMVCMLISLTTVKVLFEFTFLVVQYQHLDMLLNAYTHISRPPPRSVVIIR